MSKDEPVDLLRLPCLRQGVGPVETDPENSDYLPGGSLVHNAFSMDYANVSSISVVRPWTSRSDLRADVEADEIFGGSGSKATYNAILSPVVSIQVKDPDTDVVSTVYADDVAFVHAVPPDAEDTTSVYFITRSGIQGRTTPKNILRLLMSAEMSSWDDIHVDQSTGTNSKDITSVTVKITETRKAKVITKTKPFPDSLKIGMGVTAAAKVATHLIFDKK